MGPSGTAAAGRSQLDVMLRADNSTCAGSEIAGGGATGVSRGVSGALAFPDAADAILRWVAAGRRGAGRAAAGATTGASDNAVNAVDAGTAGREGAIAGGSV